MNETDKKSRFPIQGASSSQSATTARERTEETLREKENFIRHVIELSPVVLDVYDLATEHHTYFSSDALNVYGYTGDEMARMPEPFAVLLEPEDIPRIRENVNRLKRLGDGEINEFECRIRRGGDGERRWINARSMIFARDAKGEARQVISATFDITERKAAEEKLIESEKRFRSYFELGLIGMAITSPDKGCLAVNDEICKILGYERDELLERNWAEMTHPEDLAADVANFDRVMAGEIDGYRLDKRWIRKDKRIIDTTISVKALRLADGSVDYFVALLEDITESKRFETLLGAQKRALEMVVVGSPLAEVLAYLASVVERQSAGSSIASLMLLVESGRLHNGAAPSLPEDYIQALEGIEADESIGTCSRAAATGEVVITPDIAADPHWQDFKHLPLGLGLQSAWSMPIVAADGRVLGTFGTYFREKREPTGFERQTVEILCETAALAIERKRAEERLRESETKYRTVFDSIDEGFCLIEMIYDAQGEPIDYLFLETNRAFEAWGIAGATGKTALELVPDLEKHWLETYGRVARTGEAVRVEDNVAAMNQWFDVYVSRVGGSGSRKVAVVVNDTTKRKQAEKNLRESEENYRVIVNQAVAGIFKLDLDGNVTFSNRRFCEMLDYSREELLEMSVEQIVYAEDLPRNNWLFERLKNQGLSYEIEKRLVRKDGSLVWVNNQVSPVFDSAGSVKSGIVVSVDITERRQAEEALRQANDELEHRVAKRTAQLSDLNEDLKKEIAERECLEADRERLLRRIVSAQEDERQRIAREMHDQLGQNLSALALKLSALKNDYDAQPELREHFASLKMIVKQLDRDVNFLVRDLRPTALDDFGLVVALSNYVRNWSKQFGVRAELHTNGMEKNRLTSEVETVLYRIAQEALTNVAKHANAENVDVLLERRADSISLIVEDNGGGFDVEQAFGRSEKGFGLVGMRERAALVAGMLAVESNLGAGATVRVRIPAEHLPNGENQNG